MHFGARTHAELQPALLGDRHRHTRLAFLALLTLVTASSARAQQQIKARVMILVDTSSSMLWQFGGNVSAGGDGDQYSLFTDAAQMAKNYYPGTLVIGVRSGTTSRLYAAKHAVTNVIWGTSGFIDYGLMRYQPGPVMNGLCANSVNCCSFNSPECVNNTDYVNNGASSPSRGIAGRTWAGWSSTAGRSWWCRGTTAREGAALGRRHRGLPRQRPGLAANPELRCAGLTPLAGSARTALSKLVPAHLQRLQAGPGAVATRTARCSIPSSTAVPTCSW